MRSRLIELDEKNLSRFGCSFKAATGVLWVDWRGRTAKKSSEASIFARLCALDTKSGPVIVLAFEISSVRPLPRYFYFPFDLSNHTHRKYLSSLTKSGSIKLRFYTGKQTTDRVHQLSPYLLSRATAIYDEAIRRYEKLGTKAYDWEACLQVLERWVRIPDLLEHSLLEETFPELQKRVAEAVKLVPDERREFAHRIVRQATEVFKPYYLNNERFISETTLLVRRGLLYLTDLQNLSTGSSAVAEDVFADGIAAALSQTELQNLDVWLRMATSLFSLFPNTPGREPNRSEQLSEPPKGMVDALQLIGTNRLVSLDSLKSLADLFGIGVRTLPGRPPRNYSREYDWKKTMSWTNVARKALLEDPEFHQEFNGVSFDDLSLAQQVALKHRIREGVKSYAKRLSPRIEVTRSSAGESDAYDFKIFPTPQALETAIRKKVEEKNTARLTAGFCWPWSKPTAAGTLIADVVIEGYARPWNARSDAGRLAAGIPKESLWAYNVGGIDQIGCVYTAQGFEFDYVGVIFGPDLIYLPEVAEWKGDKTKSFDTVVKRSGERFTQMVKNTYRVLLTRGMKGCYVYFVSKDTENFFRSRLENTLHTSLT